jgi:hypothetical protein
MCPGERLYGGCPKILSSARHGHLSGQPGRVLDGTARFTLAQRHTRRRECGDATRARCSLAISTSLSHHNNLVCFTRLPTDSATSHETHARGDRARKGNVGILGFSAGVSTELGAPVQTHSATENMKSDEADLLQRFIVSGYCMVPPSGPADVHEKIAREVLNCGLQAADSDGMRRTPYGLAMLDGDAAGNNLLHAAPALQGEALLESPHLTRVLRSILGEGYQIHPHRRAHWRQKGAKTSMWHVDAYKGLSWSGGRQHEPHWVMVCYYPQRVTLGLGPTELLPGSQYLRGDSDRDHYSRGHIPDFGEQMDAWAVGPQAVLCEAGAVCVMHFDLWHRALETTDDDASRLMLKFVAWRTAPPVPVPVPPVLSHAGAPPSWPLAEGRCSPGEIDSTPLLSFLDQTEKNTRKECSTCTLPLHFREVLRAHLKERCASGELWPGGHLALGQRAAAAAEAALFDSAIVRAKEEAAAERLPFQRIPEVIKWLAPECAEAVRVLTFSERRARFVKDRAPIWWHIWCWLHGMRADDASNERERADSFEGLGQKLLCGSEPERLCTAYRLAQYGRDGLARLLAVIGSSSVRTSVRRTAMYGMTAACAGAEKQQLMSSIADTEAVFVSAFCGSLADDQMAGTSDPEPVGEKDDTLAETLSGDDWMPASIIRKRDGFDAELLLAAARPNAEARYLKLLAIARSSAEGWASLLISVLRSSAVSTSERMVVLEALGSHGVGVGQARHSIRELCAVLASPMSDGGARAVAARALAQIGFQAISHTVASGEEVRLSLAEATSSLSSALADDSCRYVRAHAAEALVCILLAHAIAAESEKSSLYPGSVSAIHALSTSGGLALHDLKTCVARAIVAPHQSHTCARWLLCRRRCPITSPSSPF